MTKSESREVAKLQSLRNNLPIETLARSYSTLIRAARTTASRNEIITSAAAVPAVVQHPEFVI